MAGIAWRIDNPASGRFARAWRDNPSVGFVVGVVVGGGNGPSGNFGFSTCTYSDGSCGAITIGPAVVSRRIQRTPAYTPRNSGYTHPAWPVIVLLIAFSHTPSVVPANRFFHTRCGPAPSQRIDFMLSSGRSKLMPWKSTSPSHV